MRNKALGRVQTTVCLNTTFSYEPSRQEFPGNAANSVTSTLWAMRIVKISIKTRSSRTHMTGESNGMMVGRQNPRLRHQVKLQKAYQIVHAEIVHSPSKLNPLHLFTVS
jgi:hypothetical protein